MADIIQLLPDNVANQIAAGEVVQRPASAVKELMENAIDAGATNICLSIKDAGKTLIQVIDNGSGMSETDARLSFERHATSKIKVADDLFCLNTKGFRGEALASIAAIAQVELKTRKPAAELGSQLIIEGSEFKSQEACSCAVGSSISVKNLFFNVPARRNFLKSNSVETKHIMDEFLRVALVHHDIAFSMYNDGNEVYNLSTGSARQRIVAVFGDKYNTKLVPLSEQTDIVNIDGFVTKPEFAKKTRGEQFFFVNNRFIKSAYLNHAVQNAFDQLLNKDQFPSYFINLHVDPSKIDINIHPTKTEIKFEDERSIYAILRTAIKQALGKNNISPTLDFEQEKSFDIPLARYKEAAKMPTIRVNPNFNPFDREKESSKPTFEKPNTKNWDSLFNDFEKDTQTILDANNGSSKSEEKSTEAQTFSPNWDDETQATKTTVLQIHQKFILTQLNQNYFFIDQQRAHERVLFEQFLSHLEQGKGNSQQLLFPETIDLSNADAEVLNEMADDIKKMGFQFDAIGRTSFVINGVPTEFANQNLLTTFEQFIEQFKIQQSTFKLVHLEALAMAMAKSAAKKNGQALSEPEMLGLVEQLFACQMPYHLPNGKPIIITLNIDDLNHQFQY